MANILDFGGVRALTSDAQPGAGYVAKFYQSGTTTPVTVYTDSTLNTAHGTSVTADSAGRFAAVWSAGGQVKCVIEDGNGAVIQTIDPVLSVSGSASAAEDVSFTPTIDLPFTNVQDAVEGAVAVAASGYAAFGLGITGNAVLLANIDATGTASGVYRFDGTTTGTYPSGVVAATTGIVTLDRQTAAEAVMTLRAAGSGRVFIRLLAATAWGSWREVLTGPAAFGTAGQVPRVNSGATALEYTAGIVLQTPVTASGQTSIPFTGVPSWVNRINVHFVGLSTSGTSNVTVRIGDSGGVENTGYSGSSSAVGNGVTPATITFTTGFAISFGTADTSAATRSGTMTLQRVTGNTWACSSVVGLGNAAVTSMTGGDKTLSDVLTQLAITTVGGTDTFDVGSVSISWE